MYSRTRHQNTQKHKAKPKFLEHIEGNKESNKNTPPKHKTNSIKCKTTTTTKFQTKCWAPIVAQHFVCFFVFFSFCLVFWWCVLWILCFFLYCLGVFWYFGGVFWNTLALFFCILRCVLENLGFVGWHCSGKHWFCLFFACILLRVLLGCSPSWNCFGSICHPELYVGSCYIQLIWNRQSFCENGGLCLFYTAAIYNSYRTGRLSVRMEAFVFSIQLLYTTHTDFLCEWRLLSFLYSCYIQLI